MKTVRSQAEPWERGNDEVRRSITETQWWIISVKRLYNLPDQPGLEYLQQIEPVERIAYAYHVYRLDPLPSDVSARDRVGSKGVGFETQPTLR